jgi:DNA-directed RNA polymerase subunit M
MPNAFGNQEFLKKSTQEGREKEVTNHAHSDGGKETISRTRASKQSMIFCPKCGSTDIFWASGLPQLWSIWDCRNCGYRGALFLKNSKLAKKLEEEYAKKSIKH